MRTEGTATYLIMGGLLYWLWRKQAQSSSEVLSEWWMHPTRGDLVWAPGSRAPVPGYVPVSGIEAMAGIP